MTSRYIETMTREVEKKKMMMKNCPGSSSRTAALLFPFGAVPTFKCKRAEVVVVVEATH